jgi:DNA primase
LAHFSLQQLCSSDKSSVVSASSIYFYWTIEETNMSTVDFAEIKSRYPIEDVARNMLGIVLKPGAALRAKCPLCTSDDPRHFAITPAKNAFYCFYEKKGGDVLSLVSRLRGCTVKEAAEAIAAHFGADRRDISPSPKQAEKKGAFDAEKYLRTLEPEHEAVSKLGVSAETLRDWKAATAPRASIVAASRSPFPPRTAPSSATWGWRSRAKNRP